MAARAAVFPKDGGDVILLMNQTYARLDAAGARPEGLIDWVTSTITGYLAAGYRCYVWENSQANNRIDACIWVIRENLTRPPDVTPQPWLVIAVLGLRYSALPDTLSAQQAMGRLLKLVVPAAAQTGYVGLQCTLPTRWAAMLDYLEGWEMHEFEPPRGTLPESLTTRAWLRFRDPSLPEFTQKTAGLTG